MGGDWLYIHTTNALEVVCGLLLLEEEMSSAKPEREAQET